MNTVRFAAAISMMALLVGTARAEPPLSTFDFRNLGVPERTPRSRDVGQQPFAAIAGDKLGIAAEPMVSATYDTSAFDDYTEKSDWYLYGAVSVSYKAATNLSVTPTVSAETFRYDRYGELDFDMLTANLSTSHTMSDGWGWRAKASSAWLFERDFGDNFLTLYDMSGQLTKTLELKGDCFLTKDASMQFGGMVARRLADNDLAERWTFSIDPQWIKKLSESMQASIGGALQYGVYDEPSDREIWKAGASASVERQLWATDTCSGSLIASVAYSSTDDSTVDAGTAVNDFEKWEIGPSIAVAAEW